MPKGFFLSLPSVSVDKSLMPVVAQIAKDGFDIICYNTPAFRPGDGHGARFRAYPPCFSGKYPGTVDETTSYFQFGDILADTAISVMDFLMEEVEKERPDFIIYSHLAFWGKLVAMHYGLPAITFNTTFILDKKIMLPFFRKINMGKSPDQRNVQDMVGFGRKSHALYERLGLKTHPDPWDVYVNKGDLNFSFILDVFQPRRHLFGQEYHFPGYPLEPVRNAQEKRLIYVSLGTIVNNDIGFYRLCMEVIRELGLPCVVSIGSKIDAAQLGPVPPSIRIEVYTDQREVLREAMLFISRGGMASVHEAIYTLTPMIVVPVIPEQRITAERVQQLGIGLTLAPEKVTNRSLSTAIHTVLQGRELYIRRLKALCGMAPVIPPTRKTAGLLRDFLLKDPGGPVKTVVDCFVRQATLHPDVIALRCGEATLTYHQLDMGSAMLARYLIRAGVQPETAVPIVMAPGIPILVAILGIMKAGAAYVPVDPHYPEDRIALILNDTRAVVVLCDEQLPYRKSIESRYILVDPAPFAGAQAPLATQDLPPLPRQSVSPSQPAYIIYTSGSTGKPKGVIVEHAQLHQYILDVYERMELAVCNSYAILGTFAADAGLTAIFCALCYGKTLDIADIRQFSHFDHIVAHFTRHPVDCYKITPSLMEWLRKQGDLSMILPRRRLLLGGEALPPSLAVYLRTLLPGHCVMYNHYGPTETTIGVITYRFPETVEELQELVPLGLPLPSAGIHILLDNDEPVPNGEAGELYIEGPLIARGYLNDPVLTNEKFGTHLISGEKIRLYKTGDLVRQLPDGNIECIGRTDDQVKIRGYRIELGEIGQALDASGMVKRSLVLAKKDKKGTPYLAGYIQPGQGFERATLIGILRKKLPVYMIPSRWVELQEWPMMVNNKTDRRALPDPLEEEEMESGSMTDMEAALTTCWEQVFDTKKPGVEKDFFELGGDSLQLLQLVYAIYDRLSLAIQPAILFEYTTIRRQAAYCSTLQPISKEARAAIIPDEHTTSDAQRNMYLQHKLDPSRTLGGASLTFTIEGSIDTGRLEECLGKMIGFHEDLRAGFLLEKGAVRKHLPADIHFNLGHIRCRSNDIDGEVLAINRPFDLHQPPLLRAYILELPDGRRYFHICMPHISSDGESLKVFMDELEDRYNGQQDDKPRQRFSDFLQSLRAYLDSESFREDELFWRKQLKSPLPRLSFGLPARQQPASYNGICKVTPFPEGLAADIRAHSRRTTSTPFRWLLAAHSLLLYKVSKCNRLAILIPVHNRNENGTERIIGLLSNVLPVIMTIDPEQPLKEWLDESRAMLLSAIAHQRYPFEKTQQLWASLGHDRKSLMQSFLGFHVHRPEYRHGSASLKPYFPLRNKENLSLSSAIFDTGTNFYLRMSSAAEPTALPLVHQWTEQYFAILRHIVKDRVTSEKVASVLV
ncbi:MAG TPA: amino acid adenylation domain-containing protein [Puia sp.]|nr:amino acid adenylation domain-containing protein [Puia sp.]